MFPIGDTDVREAGPGLISIGLIIVNVAVFIFQASLPMPALERLIAQYGVVPARVLRGEQLHALLTSMFLHGGWFHVISNMLFLWIFGDNVEAALGKLLYPLVYLGGGLAASALHIIVSPGSTVPSLGASGAIAAILGAYVVMFPRSQIKVLLIFGFFATVRRVTAVIFLGIWFVSQFFNGVAALGAETAQTGGVAFWAHVGGFIFGLLVGILFRGRAEELTLETERRERRYRRV
jgi:membrane associated rhomboid family serine protease